MPGNYKNHLHLKSLRLIYKRLKKGSEMAEYLSLYMCVCEGSFIKGPEKEKVHHSPLRPKAQFSLCNDQRAPVAINCSDGNHLELTSLYL